MIGKCAVTWQDTTRFLGQIESRKHRSRCLWLTKTYPCCLTHVQYILQDGTRNNSLVHLISLNLPRIACEKDPCQLRFAEHREKPMTQGACRIQSKSSNAYPAARKRTLAWHGPAQYPFPPQQASDVLAHVNTVSLPLPFKQSRHQNSRSFYVSVSCRIGILLHCCKPWSFAIIKPSEPTTADKPTIRRHDAERFLLRRTPHPRYTVSTRYNVARERRGRSHGGQRCEHPRA